MVGVTYRKTIAFDMLHRRGTPTVLSGPEWIRLAEMLERHFTFDAGAEVTVEANPNSLRAEHLLFWRDWRTTRVSIGAQSFDDAELIQLGRLHSAAGLGGHISLACLGVFGKR